MIRIKIALVEPNDAYRMRLAGALEASYQDRVEVVSFSSLEKADEFFAAFSADVMLVGDELAEESLDGRKGAVLVYLVDSASVESLFGHKAIARYQKVDAIYRSVLEAGTGMLEGASVAQRAVSQARVVTFFPASGGAGASTMAAACALGAAKRGKRTFYLNLELFGTSKTYFNSAGQGGLEDVLFAIGVKKSNVGVRLQARVKTGPYGVRFLDSCENPLDTFEISPDTLRTLVREIDASDPYDLIVIDMDFGCSKLAYAAMDLSSATVFVSNGTQASNTKFERIYRSLQALAKRGDIATATTVVLAYNNFNSKTGVRLSSDLVPVLGSMPRTFADAKHTPLEPAVLVDALSRDSLVDNLLAIEAR